MWLSASRHRETWQQERESKTKRIRGTGGKCRQVALPNFKVGANPIVVLMFLVILMYMGLVTQFARCPKQYLLRTVALLTGEMHLRSGTLRFETLWFGFIRPCDSEGIAPKRSVCIWYLQLGKLDRRFPSALGAATQMYTTKKAASCMHTSGATKVQTCRPHDVVHSHSFSLESGAAIQNLSSWRF